MGNPNPDSFPEIDPAKWYHVWAAVYFQIIPPPGFCSDPYQYTTQCCVTGWWINFVYNGVYDCTNINEVCFDSGGSAERILRIRGPFDTQALCLAD